MVEIQKEWLLAARKGDVDAFGRVVDAFQKPVFNLCYRMLGNPEDAEDAAQESFWRAYQGLSKYDFQRPFGTWMLSIAAHYCIDRLRRKRPIILSLESLLPEDDAPDETPLPEDQTHRKQEQEAVQQLLAGLGTRGKGDDRDALLARYVVRGNRPLPARFGRRGQEPPASGPAYAGRAVARPPSLSRFTRRRP